MEYHAVPLPPPIGKKSKGPQWEPVQKSTIRRAKRDHQVNGAIRLQNQVQRIADREQRIMNSRKADKAKRDRKSLSDRRRLEQAERDRAQRKLDWTQNPARKPRTCGPGMSSQRRLPQFFGLLPRARSAEPELMSSGKPRGSPDPVANQDENEGQSDHDDKGRGHDADESSDGGEDHRAAGNEDGDRDCSNADCDMDATQDSNEDDGKNRATHQGNAKAVTAGSTTREEDESMDDYCPTPEAPPWVSQPSRLLKTTRPRAVSLPSSEDMATRWNDATAATNDELGRLASRNRLLCPSQIMIMQEDVEQDLLLGPWSPEPSTRPSPPPWPFREHESDLPEPPGPTLLSVKALSPTWEPYELPYTSSPPTNELPSTLSSDEFGRMTTSDIQVLEAQPVHSASPLPPHPIGRSNCPKLEPTLKSAPALQLKLDDASLEAPTGTPIEYYADMFDSSCHTSAELPSDS